MIGGVRIIERQRLRRGKLRLRRRGDEHGQDGDRVIRVALGPFGRTYAYLCRGAGIGDAVEVDSPISGRVVTEVVGFGRDGYRGPLKRARKV